MLDRIFVRENLDLIQKRLRLKGFEFDRGAFQKLDEREHSLRIEWEEARATRNRASDEIVRARKEGKDANEIIQSMRMLSARIKELDQELADLEMEVRDWLSGIPNLPHESVPPGADESANRVERIVGEIPSFDFTPRDHVELGSQLGILDLERAAKIAGARFSLYLGAGALLERALINFMLDVHTREHGYREALPPFMANKTSFFGTGNLPKFEADLFKVQGTDYYLVPTAEVPITNIFADEILEEEQLPLHFAAYTPCFRSEAGSYGRDTRGLIRQHQFNKVELVKFTRPDHSYQFLEELTAHAEEILKRLQLAYRVVTLSGGDMSFSSAKTYDIEVWIPSQNTYREISSCSNFEDFQARRAGIRFRPSEGKRTRYVHTLNGSGLAIGRTWLAIIENFQQIDGSIVIPEALRSYMYGMERITADSSS